MDDGCHELPLPAGISYEMLIPFTIAWRSTSVNLPWDRRAGLVASHLQSMGYMTSRATVLAAADTLVDALDMDTVRAPPAVVDLVPPDRTCCVCGCAELTTSSRTAQGTLHGLSTSQTVRMQSKECPRCATAHHYSFFSAATAMAVLFVPDAKHPPLEVCQLASALKRMGVPSRTVKRHPSDPAMLLTRGFDVTPTRFAAVSPSDDKLLATLQRLVPSTNDALFTCRFRANVLDLPVFVPATTQGRFIGSSQLDVFDAELLQFVTNTMERTQVRAVGVAVGVSSSTASPRSSSPLPLPLAAPRVTCVGALAHRVLRGATSQTTSSTRWSPGLPAQEHSALCGAWWLCGPGSAREVGPPSHLTAADQHRAASALARAPPPQATAVVKLSSSPSASRQPRSRFLLGLEGVVFGLCGSLRGQQDRL